MLENRLHLHPSHTQEVTTTLLATYGLVSLVSAPLTAFLSDKMGDRKIPLLIALCVCVVGTCLVAYTPSSRALVTFSQPTKKRKKVSNSTKQSGLYLWAGYYKQLLHQGLG